MMAWDERYMMIDVRRNRHCGWQHGKEAEKWEMLVEWSEVQRWLWWIIKLITAINTIYNIIHMYMYTNVLLQLLVALIIDWLIDNNMLLIWMLTLIYPLILNNLIHSYLTRSLHHSYYMAWQGMTWSRARREQRMEWMDDGAVWWQTYMTIGATMPDTLPAHVIVAMDAAILPGIVADNHANNGGFAICVINYIVSQHQSAANTTQRSVMLTSPYTSCSKTECRHLEIDVVSVIQWYCCDTQGHEPKYVHAEHMIESFMGSITMIWVEEHHHGCKCIWYSR